MTNPATPAAADGRRGAPDISRAGMWQGAVQTLPFSVGLFIFGAAVGAAASQKGLTFWQSIAQSAFVYAGASQLLTLQLWPVDWTLGAVLTAAGVTAAINSRFVLMGATFRPWLVGLDRRLVYISLFFLTDAAFAIGARHHANGGRDYGQVIGAHIPLYLVWIATTALGYVGGTLVAQPERYGLDLVLPLVFTTMAVPMVRRAGRIAPFAIAGLVAILTSWIAPGWFIVVGALAGALSAAFIDEAA
jgi:predicted branched-subunit amino acid permease